ncbi:MAG: hypothetical protein ACFFDY_01140 [Candidatus Thorarchaeota archaeon]
MFKKYKLRHFGNINPALSRLLYWLTGWANILDGLLVVLTLGFYHFQIPQRFYKIRVWFMQRKNNKMVAQQHKERSSVACEIYTKKKRRGYFK